jgi:hypothetical protein
MQAFAALTALAASLSLHSQPAKCRRLVCQPPEHAPPYGLLATSTPALRTVHAGSCASCACFLMEELLALPLGDQDSWLMLHGSLQKQVAHLPRGSRWKQVEARRPGRAERQEQGCGLCLLCHGPSPRRRPPDRPTHPPPPPQSLDMARTGPAEGNAAYLAAAATTQLAMQGGPAAFWPFDRPSSEQLQPLWDTLHDTAVGLWPPEAHEGSPDTMVVFPEAQHTLSKHSA